VEKVNTIKAFYKNIMEAIVEKGRKIDDRLF